MIDLEKLNNQSFDDIVESAKKQITQLSDEWTNTQESDPGITLIELFAWLKVIQHDHINEIKDAGKIKFLDLLNIERKYNKGAKTLLHVSNVLKDQVIPRGTKWYVDDMDFENNRAEQIISSNIVSVEIKNKGKSHIVKREDFDDKRIFNIFGELDDKENRYDHPTFTINFDKPISKDQKFSIYFKTFLEDKYKRNPIKPGDDFIDMAKVFWEFYGRRGKSVGWHRVRVIFDNTHKFLFSGAIKFEIEGEMLPLDGNYSIRAKLMDQNYDFAPRITNIKTNVFEVTQKSTMCENIIVKKNMLFQGEKFSIASNLAIYGDHLVYVRYKDGWKKIDSYRVEQKVKENVADFYVENLKAYTKNLSSDDDAVMVISYDKAVSSKILLASGKGCSSQMVKFPLEDVCYDDFGLMCGYLKDGVEIFDKWDKVTDFYSSSKYDKHYVLDFEKDRILFGNHEMGQAPRKGKDNIILCSLTYTKGKDSNIREGMIKNVRSQNPLINQLVIDQITPAKGGRDSDQFEDIKNKAADVLENDQKAVTADDFERIAKQTPGLIIENIKVLPPDNENESDVNIVVRNGYENPKNPNNLKSYEDNIKNYLDSYRLINTQVKVTGPLYVGLEIRGQIVVNSYYKQSADEISDEIMKFVEKLNRDCGQTLYYGDLFGTLDKLHCVSYVDSLYIETSGADVKRNMADDVIVPANAVYYIENLDINYIKSANI